MWNKNKQLPISKGLLLAVVLFCFSNCKSYSSESTTITTPILWDTTMPNPTRYLLFGNGKKPPTLSDTLSKEELTMLEDGDILLRKGFGSISDFIADFLDETYPVTHCAFVINTQNNTKQVLHTASNEAVNSVHVESLEQYIEQSALGSLVLVRLKYPKAEKKQVLDLAHKLLKEKIPFDMGFNDRDDQALYCVELMRNLFLTVFEEDLLPNRSSKNTIDVISMDNFFNSVHFEVIFNHFDPTTVINKTQK